jgi:transcriptional/translational regulatory protein YebC/TACO1
VAYLFSRSGLITFAPGVDEDVLLEVGLESGADDVIVADDGSVDVLTPLGESDRGERCLARGRARAIRCRGDHVAQY